MVPGYVGSYPNFLSEVDAAEVETFAQALTTMRSASDLEQVVLRSGVRRSSPRMWAAIDGLHDDLRRRRPGEFGILDFNRYLNL